MAFKKFCFDFWNAKCSQIVRNITFLKSIFFIAVKHFWNFKFMKNILLQTSLFKEKNVDFIKFNQVIFHLQIELFVQKGSEWHFFYFFWEFNNVSWTIQTYPYFIFIIFCLLYSLAVSLTWFWHWAVNCDVSLGEIKTKTNPACYSKTIGCYLSKVQKMHQSKHKSKMKVTIQIICTMKKWVISIFISNLNFSIFLFSEVKFTKLYQKNFLVWCNF